MSSKYLIGDNRNLPDSHGQKVRFIEAMLSENVGVLSTSTLEGIRKVWGEKFNGNWVSCRFLNFGEGLSLSVQSGRTVCVQFGIKCRGRDGKEYTFRHVV